MSEDYVCSNCGTPCGCGGGLACFCGNKTCKTYVYDNRGNLRLSANRARPISEEEYERWQRYKYEHNIP